MQPGEVVVARLGKGASIVRVLKTADDRIGVAIGRNKQARLPPSRIIMSTGVILSNDEEMESVRRRCEALKDSIDLSEVWATINEKREAIDLNTLAELYWGGSVDISHRLALALHLEENDYFMHVEDSYAVRSRELVEERIIRRKRTAEVAEASEIVMANLSNGQMPDLTIPDQLAVIKQLRSYAVFGDDYIRSRLAKDLLQPIPSAIGDLQQRCFELLVGANIFSADEPLDLYRGDISLEFPEDVLTEAMGISTEFTSTTLSRRDLTNIPTISIDNAETVDRDDALSIIDDSYSGAAETVFVLAIHIADAGALIPYKGAMDTEANKRMSTLYIPEGRIDMLPSRIVRGIGSLDPGERRAALTVMVHVTDSGCVVKSEIFPSIVRSDGALAYKDADKSLGDEKSPWHQFLSSLTLAARSLRTQREEAGAINIDRREMSIRVMDTGNVEVNLMERTSPSRQIVSELMILANCLMAEYCVVNTVPTIYRSQQAPSLAGLPDDNPADKPVRKFMTMKRFAPVEMSTHAGPHKVLGVNPYLQATSPLRRYPDLLIQRQISHHLGTGEALYSTEEMASVGQRAEVQMKELGRIEEQRKRYWFLKYLKQVYLDVPSRSLLSAVVLENQPNRHALLELEKYPFRFRTYVAPSYGAGHKLTLKLHSVDLWRRSPLFIDVSDNR